MGSVLTQITNNRFHDVLAQITRDNFFLWKDKDKNLVWTCTNHNKQMKMSVSTKHKKQFFSMKGQGQKCGLCWHLNKIK